MNRIDCHSHFFDPYITDGLSRILADHQVKEERTYAARSEREFLNPEQRLGLMDQNGIDMAAIEYHIVYQHYDETKFPASIRVEMARFVNDRLSEVCRQYPDRYLMMADMPLLDVQAAIKELERCAQLGATGLCLQTHINGRPLIAPEFRPFWAEVDRLGLPVFLHPRSDLKPQRLSQFVYTAILGYPFDTSLTGLDLLMDDFFTHYPRLRVMLCHCGGTLPFIKKRLDMAAAHYDGPALASRLNLFFYDTAISFPNQLRFTIEEVGLDQLCFGSDYPYYSFEEAIAPVEGLGRDRAFLTRIFQDNPRRFLGLG